MSTDDKLRQAVGAPAQAQPGQSIAPKQKTFPQLLEAFKPEIARALPKHMNADRMARIALTAFRQTPKLAECEPRSVFAAVVVGAQLGLEPGIMGQAYLIPYDDHRKNITVCQFIPGWQGLADIVSRSGRASVWTGAVYEGDQFDYEYGSSPRIQHMPADKDEDTGQLTHCYAVGRIKGADYPVIEVWSAEKITRHRDRFNKVGKRHYSYEHFEMYGRKVALLQVLKYMPKSVELAQAVTMEHAATSGEPPPSLTEAIEGSWAPVDSDQPTGGSGEQAA